MRRKETTVSNNIAQEPYVISTPTCGICNKDGYVEATLEGYLQWNFGMLIQDAFPTMPAPLREQLKTGTHPECYQKMLGR